VNLPQLPKRNSLERRVPATVPMMKHLFRIGVSEAPDHAYRLA
jgi:hypothetical protein